MDSGAFEIMGLRRGFVVCVAAFAISISLRLVEASRWDPDTHRVDDEYLLATHDAYAWVAGAVHADARTADHPMANLLSAVNALTGFSPAALAFWLPPVLAGLTAIPAVLWAVSLGARPAYSLAAGVLTSVAPAFYARTRLGYFDTDWATLLFPGLASWLLLLWLLSNLRHRNLRQAPILDAKHGFASKLALLMLIPASFPWHGSIRIYLLVTLWLTLGLIWWLGDADSRRNAYVELTAFTLAVGLGWIGAGFGALIFLIQDRFQLDRIERAQAGRWVLAVLVVCLLTFSVIQLKGYLIDRIDHYLRVPTETAAGLAFPELSPSVRETQQLNIMETLQGAAFQSWIGVAGLVAFLLTVFNQPGLLLLVPALAIGLLSPVSGVRFAMFASMPIFVSMALFTSRVIPLTIRTGVKSRDVRSDTFILIAIALLMIPIYSGYVNLPVETVLEKGHASALRELGSGAHPDGLVWTWWDYGYATQYFTGMPTFADGGRNTGPYLLVLGKVLGSDNLADPAGLIRYAASHDFRPWEGWQQWDAATVDDWFRGSDFLQSTTKPETPQYLIVQWEAISFLAWIQNYGSWEFESRSGSNGFFVQRSQPRELDLEAGHYTDRWGQEYRLASADVFEASGTAHYEYPDQSDGLHLLIDLKSSDVFLVDARSYKTNLIQLLLISPEKAAHSGSLELVIDRGPEARIFAVR